MKNRNRRYNSSNPYQGKRPKVLCVCSAGLLRSPTAAWVLSNEPFNFNTRAAGAHDYALIPVDDVLVDWADIILCMNWEHVPAIERIILDEDNEFPEDFTTQVHVLDIPDNYEYRDEELIRIIKEKALKYFTGEGLL